MSGRFKLAWLGMTALLIANVLLVFAGPLLPGFPAATVYKPLLLFNAWCLLTVLLARRCTEPQPLTSGLPWPAIAAVTAAVYVPSLWVNFQHHDWTHRHISAGLTSAAAFGRLFSEGQSDGMYRPLTFISLWLDSVLFGPRLWGYHLQSIAIHAATSVIVGLLALRMGLVPATARFAALLFGVGAIRFEAVVWPAARFDLLATLFACLSILSFLRLSFLSVVFFVAAVLNKELAYAVVPIAALLAPRVKDRRRAVVLLAALAVAAAVLLAVRFAIYGGIGGYREPQVLALKPYYSLAVNTLALSQFGVNASVPLSWPMRLGVAAFLLLSAALCWFSRRGKRVFALLALLAALPALDVIGWIQGSLLHTRHLYWPSVWVALLIAAAARDCPRAVLFAYLGVQAAGLTHNIAALHCAVSTAEAIAMRVASDAGATNAHAVTFVNFPSDLDGALLFNLEVQHRILARVPGTIVRLSGECGELVYRWDSASRSLQRVDAPKSCEDARGAPSENPGPRRRGQPA